LCGIKENQKTTKIIKTLCRRPSKLAPFLKHLRGKLTYPYQSPEEIFRAH
jgi:hypothetical protein